MVEFNDQLDYTRDPEDYRWKLFEGSQSNARLKGLLDDSSATMEFIDDHWRYSDPDVFTEAEIKDLYLRYVVECVGVRRKPTLKDFASWILNKKCSITNF